MTTTSKRQHRWRHFYAAFGALSLLVGYSTACSEQIQEVQKPLGGTCLACHEGITDVHPYFALACVDCHGGNDQVPEIQSALAARAPVNIRDQAFLKSSHVLPLDPRSWWANGIDDDDDGEIDEVGEFFDPRLEREGIVGVTPFQIDSEMNTDMDYLRFINPGDLRVAQVGCGTSNRNANAAMVCHAQIIYDVRRSIMANLPTVPAGAYYGNAQEIKASDFGAEFEAEFGAEFDAQDPRIGRVGYTYNYDALDDPRAFDPAANKFNRDFLLEVARSNVGNDPLQADDEMMATKGPIFDVDGVETTRYGNPVKFPDRASKVLQSIPQRPFPPPGSMIELRLKRVLGLGADGDLGDVLKALDKKQLGNPVDNVLLGFRPFQPLNMAAFGDNFPFQLQNIFTTDPDPNDEFVVQNKDPSNTTLIGQNNPFGRGRATGCTACHISYTNDGRNLEPFDRTVADNGRNPSTELPFGIRTDLGERFYAARHSINRVVEQQTCGKCHFFVTRVDLWYSGMGEIEADQTQGKQTFAQPIRMGPYDFTTPNGTKVHVFDNLARWENGRLVNAGEGISEDRNNNGELDEGEDTNANGALDLPDRVARSQSNNGTQLRFVYGGANGSTRQSDIHFDLGLHCVDCHSEQDVHGDGNIYTRNWDQIEIECDDCHGTPYEAAKLVTSGPNGGTDLTKAFPTAFGKPWFERRADGAIIQNSRVDPNLSWVVKQAFGEGQSAAARYAHEQKFDNNDGDNPFAHIAPAGGKGGMECYTCHSAFQPNCMSCHYEQDVAKTNAEVFFTADGEHDGVNFQLFGFVRSPFLLGRAGDVEGNKISTYRSTMELFYSATAGPNSLFDNVMFSTREDDSFNKTSLSSMALNPYFPHVVRRAETKSCSRCHTLVDDEGRVSNDHLVSEAAGEGTGRFQNVGDWLLVATQNGFEQIDAKKETGGARNVFPGFLFDDKNPRKTNVALNDVKDVALLRGASAVNGGSEIADLALLAHADGLSIIEVTGRDSPGFPPTPLALINNDLIDNLGPVVSVDNIEPGVTQSRRAVILSGTTLAVIDFVGVLENARDILELDQAPGVADVDANGAKVVDEEEHGLLKATKVRLHGRRILVTHSRGLAVYEMEDADNNIIADLGKFKFVTNIDMDQPALDVAPKGRFAFVACGAGGVEVVDFGEDSVDNSNIRLLAKGKMLHNLPEKADSRGLTVWGDRLVVADGKNGLRIVDISVPEAPILEETISVPPRGGAKIDQANAVVMASVPTRTYALVADGAHGIRAVNLTPFEDMRTQLANPSRSFKLSSDLLDPLTPYDPLNRVREILTYPTNTPAVAIARGIGLDTLFDAAGRQLRDGWMIGMAGIGDETTRRMREVKVVEVPGSADTEGDGIGCVVRDTDLGQAEEICASRNQ